jgi:hypothetical protein
MLSLTKAQRALLVKQLSDGGNLAAAALVFGPFISARPFSVTVWLTGVASWVMFAASTQYVAGKEPQ